MPLIYSSEAAAFRRVDVLRREHGIWPGVVSLGCGHYGCSTSACRHVGEARWTLTFDPGDILTPNRRDRR